MQSHPLTLIFWQNWLNFGKIWAKVMGFRKIKYLASPKTFLLLRLWYTGHGYY